MLDLHSITDEIQQLSDSLVYWNKALIIGMVATAIAASFLAIAQVMVNRDSKALSVAQDRLLKLKDDRLAKELADKDLLIAGAKEEAAKASERASQANLALEKFKLPRLLTDLQRESLEAEMRRFEGTIVEISGTDNESLGFGLSITDALVKAGWARRTWTGGGNLINLPGRAFKAGHVMDDGVHIRIFSKELVPQKDALVAFITNAGFNGVKESSVFDLPDNHPSKRIVHIMIGTKM